MFHRILMVCVGNVCRSPMAAGLLARRLARQPGVSVQSAGVAALVGRPVHPQAWALMRERGIDLSGHRGRQLTAEMLRASDLVVVMEERLGAVVEEIEPASHGRVHRIGRFGDFDVLDPVGGERADFEAALALIEIGIDQFGRAFWRGS
jgi:protein-tyrosine phosphatase